MPSKGVINLLLSVDFDPNGSEQRSCLHRG